MVAYSRTFILDEHNLQMKAMDNDELAKFANKNFGLNIKVSKDASQFESKKLTPVRCFSCGKKTTVENNYCHGCGNITCNECAIKCEHYSNDKHGRKRRKTKK